MIPIQESDKSIHFQRVLNAPIELVFEAWTRPEHLARWWGPTGFSLTTSSFDLKPGGIWDFIMHGPDGRDFENRIRFVQIAKPGFLHYQQMGGGDTEDISFEVKLYLSEIGENQTLLSMKSTFPTAELLQRVAREFGAIEGGIQHLDRLEEILNESLFKNESPELEIRTTRLLNYPRKLVYEAWTNPSSLKQWWGPKGFTNTFHEYNFKEGGQWKFTMHGPDNGNYENECTFLNIQPPYLIHWNRQSQPYFRVIATFDGIAGERTHIIFRQVFENKELRDKIFKYTEGKNDENFDRLEAVLSKLAQ
ncbi:SRPBCC domain-containing protein [Marinoscillum sp. MHG1-6]|uniref:SRPBCC domain-containing protein n=1 Tax=Marinoscillum sp. MHG1-6 TaxID=2959627 RepID=UPI002157686D|nr:SRPBCC domain-containing protein [Marinoscillum sp. MHG1-6]